MNKPAIFCWGRFQPPHLGHEELIDYTVKLAKEWNGQAYLFASATDNEFDDPKKRKTYNGAERKGTLNKLRLKKNENPLKWKDKHHILTLMFGKKFPSLKIISIRNVVDIPSLLRKRFHHRNLILVVGRDRYDNEKGKLVGLMRKNRVHVIGKPRSKITSGTDIRKSALQGNLNTVHSLLGKNISRKKAEHIVDLIKKNSYFAGKGYPGQGGRRTRRKRQRSRKKRGRKTHKRRRKKRTRRRRSRRRH